MLKYYAVKKGRKVGVFSSWQECKNQVESYSGALYKSFKSIEAAQAYLHNDNNSSINTNKVSVKTISIYVDGSYMERLDAYAYGCIILEDKIKRLSGVGTDRKYSSLRNVSGELLGTMEAIIWAEKNKYKKVVIHHDYEGVAKWATGEWNANKDVTKEYVQFIEKYKKLIEIDFIKVRAHSGDKYNEEADMLAKQAFEEHDFQVSNSTISAKKNNKSRELELFERIVKKESNLKNNVIFKVKDYELTENKLIKVAKEIWKFYGHKIKEIDHIDISVNTESLFIDFSVTNREKRELTFKLNIE